MQQPGILHGLLVAFEGIDGVGKSTLANNVWKRFNNRELPCVQDFEPRRESYGAELRKKIVDPEYVLDPYEELALFILDRKEHVDEYILPKLHKRNIVLLDRYYYSSMAYQGAGGLDPWGIERMHKVFAPEPDLLVILDLDVDVALARVKMSRGEDTDAFEKRDFLVKVRQIFDDIVHPNLLRLDANLSPPTLMGVVEQAIDKLIEKDRIDRENRIKEMTHA